MAKLLSVLSAPPSEFSRPLPKSRGAAFLLSLVLPGAGQMYCGKWGTGMWTAAFYVGSLAGLLFLGDMRWVFFRPALALYIFAFVDAFLAAQEASGGADLLPGANPRIAAVLNLLTRGFGYFYLGERKLGFIVFFVLLFFAQARSVAIQAVMEFAFIVMAIHAYRLCRRMYPPAESEATRADLFEKLVYALAGTLAAGYFGLVLLALQAMDKADPIPGASASASLLVSGIIGLV